MLIASFLAILIAFVVAMVIRAQEQREQREQRMKEPMKELAFLVVRGDAEAKKELEKAGLDPQEYPRLFERAVREKAESGNSEATRYMGNRFYAAGDFKQALQWYARAAEGGDVIAMRYLAGSPDPKETSRYGLSLEERFKWALCAANHGDGLSMLHTASWLEYGTGVQKSTKGAVMWYERTCACESAPLWCVNIAHCRLGVIYGEPNSGFLNPSKWRIHYNALVQALRSASKQRDAKGYADAALCLGRICATSLALGTEPAEELKNKKRAAYVLTLSYEAGEDRALEYLKELAYEIDDATYRIWAEDARNLNVNMLSL